MEKELCIKEVMFNGSPLRACRDENGMVYVGLRWVCEGIGLSLDRTKYERKKVQEDITLYKGVKFYPLGNSRGKSDVLCLQIDYLPLWLAKISVTPKMEKENPLLVERIVEYQLRAKDVLAREFIGGTKDMSAELQMLNQKLDQLYDSMGKLAQIIMMGSSVIKEQPKTAYELWKEEIYSRINEYLKNSFKYSCPQGVLRFITSYMRTNYGIVWEQEAKEYMEKYESKPRKLNLIYEKEDLKSIFESILTDMICNQGHDTNDSIKGVIEPLIKKLNDTSRNGCATYRKVFHHMSSDHGVDWSKVAKKYGLKMSKTTMVVNDSKLKEIFNVTVNEMLKGM